MVLELADLARELVDNKQGQLPRPHLEVLCSKSFVAAEKNRLSNVLGHLIDNAQQATEADGSIEVTITRRAAMYAVEIKDSGNGMSTDFIRDRLFKPFDTTKGNAGMGIGMHESRDLVRSMGGDIHVQSKLKKGSIITVQLPVIKQSDAVE